MVMEHLELHLGISVNWVHRSWSSVWSATEKGGTLKAGLRELIWSRVTCGPP